MNRIILYMLTALAIQADRGRSEELTVSPWQISLASTVFDEEREVFLHHSGGGYIRSRWLHDKYARLNDMLPSLKERGSEDYYLMAHARAYDFVPLTLDKSPTSELATLLSDTVKQFGSWHRQTPTRYAVEDGATITLQLDVGSDMRIFRLGPAEYSQEFEAFINRLHSILPLSVPLLDEIIAGQTERRDMMKEHEARLTGPAYPPQGVGSADP
jgi:hypothetical protein